jgi:thiamine pyrophosphokinase
MLESITKMEKPMAKKKSNTYDLSKAGKTVVERFDEATARDEFDGNHICILHGLEKAMIGTAQLGDHTVAIYERGLCIQCIADGMNDSDVAKLHADEYSAEELKNPELIRTLKLQDAEEFFEYNTVRALPYMGDATPLIIEGFAVDGNRWDSFKSPLDGPVTVNCYGHDRTYETRQEAIDFYKEGIRCSEGAEQERYVRIVMQLEDGAMHATDEE